MMRQAGRYLPAYRAVRAPIDFLTLCKTPELAAEVTVQPVDIVGVDAAIIFADILLIPEAMGMGLHFAKGEGPVLEPALRRAADLDRLVRPDVEKRLGYVYDALRTVRRALDGRVPLIGFAGTPWTVAAYMVEGGTSKNFAHLLSWSHQDPTGLRSLLDRIAEATNDYLHGQIEAGAQALQLFDTWGGLLDADRFERLALPTLHRAMAGLRGKVPLIYYSQNTAHLLPLIKTLPVDVLSVDWRLPLRTVREQVGSGFALQGNLDPTALLTDPDHIDGAVARLVEQGRGGAHIINLGHGILPMTPVPNAKAFIDAAKKHSRTASAA